MVQIIVETSRLWYSQRYACLFFLCLFLNSKSYSLTASTNLPNACFNKCYLHRILKNYKIIPHNIRAPLYYDVILLLTCRFEQKCSGNCLTVDEVQIETLPVQVELSKKILVNDSGYLYKEAHIRFLIISRPRKRCRIVDKRNICAIVSPCLA